MAILTPADTGGRVRDADDLHGAILAWTIILSSIAFSLHFTSFLHAKLGVLVAGLLLLLLIDPLRTPMPRRGLRFFLPVWCFLLWALVSGLWFGAAKVSSYTIETAGGLAVVTLVACVGVELQLNGAWRGKILNAIALSTVIVAVLALAQLTGLLTALFPRFEHYDQPMYSVFGNQGLLGGYLALGTCLFLYRFLESPQNDRYVFGAMLILIPTLVLAGSRSAWLAAAAGVLTLLLNQRNAWARAAVIGIPAFSIVLLLCAFLPGQTLGRVLGTFSPSDVGGNARLWFWEGAIRMLVDHPVLGVGLGNFAFHSPWYQGAALDAAGGEDHYSNLLHTLHAHSDPLELLVEAGPVGLVLAAWMILKLRRLRGPEWGGLVSLLVFSCFNATFISPPHFLAGLLLAGSLYARQCPVFEAEESDTDSPDVSSGVLLAAAVVAVYLVAWTTLVPSYRMRSADRAEEAGEPGIRERYARVAEARWPNYPAMEAHAVALIEAGDYSSARDSLRRAREGLDTGRVWFFRGATAEYLGDIDRAREYYRECLWRWPRDAVTWGRLLRLSGGEEQRVLRAEAARWLSAEDLARLF